MAREPSFAPTGVREAETMYTGLTCGCGCGCQQGEWRVHKRRVQRTIMRACLIFCDKRRREVRIVYTAENRGVAWWGEGGGKCSYERGEFKGSASEKSSGVIICMRRI